MICFSRVINLDWVFVFVFVSVYAKANLSNETSFVVLDTDELNENFIFNNFPNGTVHWWGQLGFAQANTDSLIFDYILVLHIYIYKWYKGLHVIYRLLILVQNNETDPRHEIKITPNANEDERKADKMKYGFIGVCWYSCLRLPLCMV